MAPTGNYDIRIDPTKNRLYILLNGFLTDAQIKAGCEKIREEVKKLKPGFDIINDISTFKPATPQGAEEIKQVQQHVVSQGVNRVIRVVGAAELAAMQIDRMSKTAGYNANVAGSVMEAEALLKK